MLCKICIFPPEPESWFLICSRMGRLSRAAILYSTCRSNNRSTHNPGPVSSLNLGIWLPVHRVGGWRGRTNNATPEDTVRTYWKACLRLHEAIFAAGEIQSEPFFLCTRKAIVRGLAHWEPHQSKFGLSGYFRIRGIMKTHCAVYVEDTGGNSRTAAKATIISRFGYFVQNTLSVSKEPFKHTQTSHLWEIFF